MATEPQQTPKIDYVERPEVAEIFADSATTVFFDGQSLRIEFCATRLDPTKPASTPHFRRFPVCRLVLTPLAAADVVSRLQQTLAALLRQAGKANAPKAEPDKGSS